MRNTVLLTGTSSGFGKATAIHFAQAGWNVVATLRNPESGSTVPLAGARTDRAPADASELRDLPNTLVTRLDVEDRASIHEAIDAGIARFGAIDAVINNAGFGLYGLFETTPDAQIRQQFAVNLFGVMDVTRAILPHFRARKSGAIVNIGSGAGVFTLPMLSLYCASKFALEGFTEALAYELLPQNIRVKMIEPGGVTSTNFGARSAWEATRFGISPSGDGDQTGADYAPFVKHANTLFEGLRAARSAAGATEADVARVIYEATVDPSDRLRYVATEDIKPLVTLRRGTSEDEYTATMRAQFAMR